MQINAQPYIFNAQCPQSGILEQDAPNPYRLLNAMDLKHKSRCNNSVCQMKQKLEASIAEGGWFGICNVDVQAKITDLFYLVSIA